MQEKANSLREQLQGAQQLLTLDQAVMAAILEITGEVTISREAVNRCLREKQTVRAEQTEGGFRLWTGNA